MTVVASLVFGSILVACGHDAGRSSETRPTATADTGTPDTACERLGVDPPVSPTLRHTLASECYAYGWNMAIVHDTADPILAIGAECDGVHLETGAVYVHDATSGALRWSVEGTIRTESLGTRLAAATPASHGVASPLVAATWGYVDYDWNVGGVRVYEGTSGALLSEIEAADSWIGLGLDFVGPYLVASAPFAHDTDGALFVFADAWAPLQSPQDALAIHRGSRDQGLGYQLHAIGDVDGDGLDDALVWGGVLRVMGEDLLTDQGIDNATSIPVSLPPGDSVTPLADFDGDGTDDYAVGSGESDYSSFGHVEVYGGAADEPSAIVYEDREGVMTDMNQHLASPGGQDGGDERMLAILELPNWDRADPASVWLINGPLCGVLGVADVGALVDLADAGNSYQRVAAGTGTLVLQAWDSDTETNLLELYSW